MEMLALSSAKVSTDRIPQMIKNKRKRGPGTMSADHKQKIIDGRMRKKKKIADGYLYLDLGNVRIVRPDELNYEVQQKNGGGTWPEGYFYGNPESAIQKVCSLVLASVNKSELVAFMADFNKKFEKMMEKVMEKK